MALSRWPRNCLQSQPSPICIHSTFACRSLPLSSQLLPSLRRWLLHTVDEAVACSWAVFLVNSEIHHSYYEKWRSRDREVNPQPLEWQASVLTARPCHSPRSDSFSVMSILTNVLVMFNFSKNQKKILFEKECCMKTCKKL